MANRKVSWTPEEDNTLLSMKQQGQGWLTVAKTLHRGVVTCQRRAEEQGWKFPPAKRGYPSHVSEFRAWTREDELALHQLKSLKLTWETIAEKLGRTVAACRQYWTRYKDTSHFLATKRKYATRKTNPTISRDALVLEKKNGKERWTHLEEVIVAGVKVALSEARLRTDILSPPPSWHDTLANFIWKSFLILFTAALLVKGAYELSRIVFPSL